MMRVSSKSCIRLLLRNDHDSRCQRSMRRGFRTIVVPPLSVSSSPLTVVTPPTAAAETATAVAAAPHQHLFHHASLQQQQHPPPLKYESYEYPWATEPPIITRTTAKEAAKLTEMMGTTTTTTNRDPNDTTTAEATTDTASTSSTTTTTSTEKSNTSLWSMLTNVVSQVVAPTPASTTTAMSSFASIAGVVSNNTTADDPFDDQHTLTPQQIAEIRHQQHDTMSQWRTSLEPVTPIVPSYVPVVSSHQTRPVPETIVTTLDNGLRIVSQETYGHVSTIGVVSTMGSRYETPQSTGVTNFMELLAFGTTDLYLDAPHVAQQLQEWLGTRFVHTGREQSMYGIDVLRPHVAHATEMIADVVLRPHFTAMEMEQAQQNLHFLVTHEDLPPEFLMSEALNEAAFGGARQQLGQPHGCPVSQIPKMTRSTVQAWHQSHLVQNPQGMVFGGAGIDHDTLVRLGEQYFGHLQQNDTNRTPLIPSVYQGGSQVVTLPPPMDGGHDLTPDQYSVVHRDKRLTRVAIGWSVGGWNSEHLVPLCVLQSLLGGGSSFSAGGPGKGMYSRLYRQILNRYHWAESAEAFTSFHNEAGLMGITGRAEATHATDMVKTFCHHWQRLANELVTEEELDRARNMLRNEVMTQLESRFVLFEDMARQVLTFGKREHVSETVAKIDAVTAEQIRSIVAQAIQTPPTLTAVGVNVQHVPSYDQVCEWLRR